MIDSAIREWRPQDASDSQILKDLEGLAQLLHACVHDGAGISFVLPFEVGDAAAWWKDKILPEVKAGTRRVLIARDEDSIVGSVQLNLATPPNQQHRADVAKLLVHPRARRRGIARTLMVRIEDVARSEGRSLLTLDTVAGSAAEPLYLAMGYVLMGVIPGYSRGPATTELEAASFLYKELKEGRSRN
ncbi:MAG: GNAT family N-acetyltransferase [Acidobacteriota bacterium]|nr:GNAT family N-acetyltransferase [Acidobacteriota bacterium]